jgi:hypothetical protein
MLSRTGGEIQYLGCDLTVDGEVVLVGLFVECAFDDGTCVRATSNDRKVALYSLRYGGTLYFNSIHFDGTP